MKLIQMDQCSCAICKGKCVKLSRLWENDQLPIDLRLDLAIRAISGLEKFHIDKVNAIKTNDLNRLRDVIKSVLTELEKPIDCQDIDGLILNCKQALKPSRGIVEYQHE